MKEQTFRVTLYSENKISIHRILHVLKETIPEIRSISVGHVRDKKIELYPIEQEVKE